MAEDLLLYYTSQILCRCYVDISYYVVYLHNINMITVFNFV